MTQAFRKMIEEKLGLTKNFIDMADLNKLTSGNVTILMCVGKGNVISQC